VFQLVATPFLLLHGPSNILYILTALLSLGVIGYNIKTGRWRGGISLMKARENLNALAPLYKVLLLLCFAIILFQAVAGAWLFTEDADDAFYVAVTTQCIDDPHLYLTHPSTGEAVVSLDSYTTTGWMAYIAYWCKFSGISSPVMSHTVMPFVLILFSYLAMLLLGKKLFPKAREQIIFMFMFSAIILFGGTSVQSKSMFLLKRIWQGKAILLTTLLPFLLITLREFYTQKDSSYFTFILGLCGICGISLNPMSIFFIPMVYVGMSFHALFHKNQRRKIGGAVLSIFPLAIYALMYYVIMIQFRAGDIERIFVDPTGKVDFARMLSQQFRIPWQAVLAIVAIPISLYTKDKEARHLFFIPVMVWVILFINPVTASFIAQYVTKPSIYWRVVWLLPYEAALAYVLVRFAQFMQRRSFVLQVTSLTLSIALIALAGNYVFQPYNGFSDHYNMAGIPNVVIAQTNEILAYDQHIQPLVLAPGRGQGNTHVTTMRQYSAKVRLFLGRYTLDDHVLRTPAPMELPYTKEQVYQIYARQPPGDFDLELWLQSVLGYDIDWIIYPEGGWAEDCLRQQGIERISATEGYALYRVTR